MAILKLPRVPLDNWPTPLQELLHLSATLGGPCILIKRDDLTGLGLGGNKCCKLAMWKGHEVTDTNFEISELNQALLKWGSM